MKWIGERESENIEDRRSEGAAANSDLDSGSGYTRQGITSLPISGKAKIFILGILVLLAMGGVINPSTVLQEGFGIGTGSPTSQTSATSDADLQNMYQKDAADGQQLPTDAARHFVGVVLADTEDVWTSVFKERGQTYTLPKMILFTGATESACGFTSSAVGPFYCPGDQKVYLDLQFFLELQNSLGAGGEFAQAYVIAHEVGHHVQKLLGTMDKVDAERRRVSDKQEKGLSVKIELQADCYAGVWAKRTAQIKNALQPGDIDEALHAASAVGDDKLQKQSQGFVVPDSFTHGSAQQRSSWFRKGYDSGSIDSCDTFAN